MVLKVVDDVEQQTDDSSKVPCSDVHSVESEYERNELVEKICRYESGEKGKLSAIFPGSLRHWLDHCYNLGEQLCVFFMLPCFFFIFVIISLVVVVVTHLIIVFKFVL